MPPPAHNVQTEPSPAPPQAPGETVGQDVACRGCGYNLRGLPTYGLCPECGRDVLPSVSAENKWRAPLPALDARWATQIVDGAALSLVSFILLIVLCAAPEAAFYYPYRNAPAAETPGRLALLCVACAAWVTTWYSVWKLSARAPAADVHAPRRRAVVARWLATAYFLLPALVAFWPRYEKNPPPGPLLFLVLAAPIAAAALFSLIAGLVRRAGGGVLRVDATVLAFCAPFALLAASSLTVFARSWHSTRVSSLDLLYDLPLFPHGTPEVGRYLRSTIGRWGIEEALVYSCAVVGGWVALLHLRLLFKYLPHATPRADRHAGPATPSESRT